MPKNIVNRIDRNLARRLREARKEVGLSTRAVAAKMPKRVAVSYVTISSYEKGTSVPPIDVLASLADIYRRPINWFLDNRAGLTDFKFRNLPSRVPLSDQRQFEAQAGKWVEAYTKLEQYLRPAHPRLDKGKVLAAVESTNPKVLSTAVRKVIGLDEDQPVQSTVSVLESFSALAVELRASFGIDGAAARHGDDFVVVLNPNTANERLRLNAAHELAYVFYSDWQQPLSISESMVEKQAYDFASTLLLPESQLTKAFDGKSFLKLIQYKERFGVSLATMIFRAEQSKIISQSQSRYLWMEMIKRGWNKKEPGYVWRDRAIGFEMMLESAIQTKALTWLDAERITGVREGELRQRLLDVTSQTTPIEAADEKGGMPPASIKFPTTIGIDSVSEA